MVPRKTISPKAVPEAIRKSLRHIFVQAGDGLWLVGGTALAGYYAEHRRSDDIDLFAQDTIAHQAAIRAAQSLKNQGTHLANERHTPTYFHADAEYEGHHFTIDIVLDENLFRIGHGVKTDDGIYVADFETLFAMKAACLVSRCSEKDLFDLDWFFSQRGGIDVAEMANKGQLIDAGVSIETLLIGIKGANLRQEACHFLLPKSPLTIDAAYKKITVLQKKLIQMLLEYEKKLPPSKEVKALKQSVKDMKKI